MDRSPVNVRVRCGEGRVGWDHVAVPERRRSSLAGEDPHTDVPGEGRLDGRAPGREFLAGRAAAPYAHEDNDPGGERNRGRGGQPRMRPTSRCKGRRFV